jgi:tripartite motif-containing protein 71
MLLLAVGALASVLASASQGATLAGGAVGSPLAGELVVPAEQMLNGGQQQAAAAAAWASPAAVLAREESRHKYAGLNGAQAAKALGEVFPAVVSEQDGGPPRLPAGQTALGFESSEVEQVEMGHDVGVVQSSLPMALETGPRKWAAVNLGLRGANGGFEPIEPLVPVRLPARLGEGAQIPSAGVSITPVDAQGAPLAGSEGVQDGTGVLFANTGTDADTVLKPSTLGVEADTVLRSVESPEVLYYKVTLPQGASLVQVEGLGSVHVVKEGEVIGAIPAPQATDASGAEVPAKMSVSGSTLVVDVPHRSGSYEYPIVVDPEYEVIWWNITPVNWEFHEWSGYTYGSSSTELWMKHAGTTHQASDYAAWTEFTPGDTKFYEFYVKDDMYPTYSGSETGYQEATFGFMTSWIALVNPSTGAEDGISLSGIPYRKEATVCIELGCSPEKAPEGEGVRFEISTTEPSGPGPADESPFGGSATNVATADAQEKGKHAKVEYNTWSNVIDSGTANVMYGSSTWFGPGGGAFEFKAKDEGLGIAETKVEYLNPTSKAWEGIGGNNYQSGPLIGCSGVLCTTPENQVFTYATLSKALPGGTDTIRVAARDPMPYSTSSEYGEGTATIKVDTTKPTGIKLSGLEGSGTNVELSEVEAHVKAEASDSQSGIREIGLYVDGKEIGKGGGSCSGSCTATNAWSLNGAELGAGTFPLSVKATDNAGNIEVAYYTLTVDRASPIGMGPGSVNPESGDFALEATDVRFSGGTGALMVTRHYDSRNVTEGEEGPLGPEWTLGLGSVAELEELPEGGVMVIGQAGPSFFTKTAEGFEAPAGDRNLKLEYKEKTPAYVLTDSAQGTTTEFTLPAGAKEWVATVSKGPAATSEITDEYKSEMVAGKELVRPILEIAPHPSLTCEKGHMSIGCRALELVYDEGTTTAKGEAESEWGNYEHRLEEVIEWAYNPATKAMAKATEAAYEYDLQGRLRAEWNPKSGAASRTTYGYDLEDHVTAVDPAGEQPWLLHYGTIPTDPSAGRLLSAGRLEAETPLWKGESLRNTVAPTLSSTKPEIGIEDKVTPGTWSSTAVAYGYQWELCTILGKACVPIPGATNPGYTPLRGDGDGTLLVVVTATSAFGSVSASTAVSSYMPLNASGITQEPTPPKLTPGTNPIWTMEYEVPLEGVATLPTMTSGEVAKWAQTDDPKYAAAIFPPDAPMGWPAEEYKRATVYYLDSDARPVNVKTPAGGISTTEFNAENDVTRTLSPNNRATAVNETNTVAASELLDTKSVYSPENNELTETLGPQHTVKLAKGKNEANETVLARNHVKYSYDEGAPGGERYELATKVTDGAETTAKEEFDVRTARTYYSGPGWKLRKPTSTVTDPAGLDLISATKYNETTGNVEETRTPGANAEPVYPPVFQSTLGASGAGELQFSDPVGDAVDASGDTWVADTGNNRIEELSAAGKYLKAFGKAGSGAGQLSKPAAVAVSPVNSFVYVADVGNHRIDVFTQAGVFVEAFGWDVASSGGTPSMQDCSTTSGCYQGASGTGLGQLTEPDGIAIDANGNVFVTDRANDRVEEYPASKTVIGQFGSAGAGSGQFTHPVGITIVEGELFIADSGNNRIEEVSPSGAYLGQFGEHGSSSGELNEPQYLAGNPSTGNLYVSDTGNHRIVEFTPAGRYLTEFGSVGTGKAEFETPEGVAISASGELRIVDETESRLSMWQPQGTGGSRMVYSTHFFGGAEGGGLAYPVGMAFDAEGNVWISSYESNRIDEYSPSGKYLEQYIPTGGNALSGPTAVAINQSTHIAYVADSGHNRIEELKTSNGEVTGTFGSAGSEPGELNHPDGLAVDVSGNVWVADTGNNRIEEFSSAGKLIAAYGKAGTGELQFKEPTSLAISGTTVYVADAGNNRIEKISTEGKYLGQIGHEGHGSGEFEYPTGVAVESAGNLYAVDSNNSRVQEFNPSGAFLSSFGSAGSGEQQFSGPTAIAINTAGTAFVSDSNNNRIEEWVPANEAVHDTKTIYYTPKEEASIKPCQDHPEWAGLPCRTEPAAQPEAGMPALPETTISYSMWNQPEIVEEKFGTVLRKKKTTFDEAGRPLTTEETSTVDEPLPKVEDKYSTTNGSLETQSTTSGGTTKTITTHENTLGELETYTDADGNKAKYKYDIDERPIEVSDGSEEGDGKQTEEYSKTTGELIKIENSADASVFSGTYEPSGAIKTETYPNGMTAYYTHNSVETTTSIEYKKETHCTEEAKEKCVWFKDTDIPSIHGETLSQTSTLARETYHDNAAGMLTQVEETPTGEGCKTRLYAYEEEGNRTSLTKREPGTEGKCATEGGTTERHTYNTANQLTDPGVQYDTVGNTAVLPAADAGEHGEITSSYYLDNQLAKQKQGTTTLEYKLDPEERTRETITTGGTEPITAIAHYDAPGSTMAWTSETGGKWTRDIAGIGGELAAIETNGHAPVLQLHDLQDNIVATASISETETKLLSTYNSTEFGVPTTKNPPPHSWLGALGISTEPSSGAVVQDGDTYIPQTGQPLQTEPVAPPIPINTAVQFTHVSPSNIIEMDAAAAANKTAEYWAALQAQKEAAHPVGACNEEVEGCGPDPEHGDDYAACGVWVSWSHYVNNELGVNGHFVCNYDVSFEMQIALLRITGPNSNIREYSKKQYYGSENVLSGKEYTLSSGGVACYEGDPYQAWVFGEYWNWYGEVQWYATAEDGHYETCPGAVEDPTGGPGTPTP